MSDKQVVLNILQSQKSQLATYGVTRLGLFGSTVRGENTKDSDIDILVDFQQDKDTYANYIAVCNILENRFAHNKLDIVTLKGLSPFIGQYILNEVEYV